MSLTILGLVTIFTVLILILTKKASPLIAMIVVPTITCILSGHALDFGGYVVNGAKSLAPTVAMFAFAIILFNTMAEVGAFDPVVNAAIKFSNNDPVKIMIAVIIISIVGHLDGAGSTTFILTIGAMSPVFDKMKLDKMYLVILCGLSAGIMNVLPWGGPTLRVMTVFELGSTEVFNPMIIPMLVGLAGTVGLGVYFGTCEKKRLKNVMADAASDAAVGMREKKLSTPKLLANWVIIVATLVIMIAGLLPPAPSMILGAAAAFILNYPSKKNQDALINKYGAVIASTMLVIFATSCFSGVLNGTGMLTAIADTIAASIPTSMGGILPIVVGVLSFPMSFLFTPDAYYYGVMPTLVGAAEGLGLSGLVIGRASLMGQMTVGFPFSGLNATSYMLPEMVGIEFADFQKRGILYGYAISLLMVVAGVVCGCI